MLRGARDEGGRAGSVLSAAKGGGAAPRCAGFATAACAKSRVHGDPSEVWTRRDCQAGGRRRRRQADRQFSRAWAQEIDRKIRRIKKGLMNTKQIADPKERKKLKRTARKKAAPKAKRASGVARGSMKRKITRAPTGTRKR